MLGKGGVMELVHRLPFETLFFISVICGFFALFNARFSAKTVAYAPTILTTLGIFATFFGIATGLLRFDVTNVQGSVPALIDGIKTAFWASVFGVGFAILIKVRAYFWGVPAVSGSEAHGATMDDLARLLGSLHTSLVGADESTVISQLKLSRQDSNDRLDSLKRTQQEFMEKMAENNSKALIEALKEVIKDFNAKINEQFGENFKQLNHAVGQILVWQETYRLQMAEMIEQQKLTATNMSTATERYSQVLSQSEQFSAVATKLDSILTSLDVNRTRLEESLTKLGTLLTAASSALPQVEQKVMELTRQVTEGARVNADEMARVIREVSGSLQTANADLKRITSEVIQTTNQEFNNHIRQITDKTKEQIQALDVALAEELTKSLETLGRQLTALSQRFVDDYTPLTDKLRQVVQLAKVS
jgi:hypothetical protein